MTNDNHNAGRTRRNLLRTGGGATAVALAGCTSLLDPDDDAEEPSDDEPDDDSEVPDDDDSEEPETAFEERFEPAAFFLTWQGDPTTSISIDWQLEADVERDPLVEYRPADSDGDWTPVEGEVVYDADEEFHPAENTDYHRTVCRAEATGLDPDTAYSFRFGTAPVWTFETLPATLDEPLTFANGGDTHYDGWDDNLQQLPEYDPAFLTICGDFPYADGGTEDDSAEMWESWFQSVTDYLVTDDGRVVPILVGIGNHECRDGYFHRMVDNEYTSFTDEVEYDDEGEVMTAEFEGDPAESRRGWAPYFYTFFPFPGDRGYDVFDVGDYLSIPMTDTYHSNSVWGAQTEWLDETLEQRRDVTHVFPHTHAPLFPSHREDDNRYTRHMQEAWLPLFERERIRITFGHHDHTTKLTPPLLDGEIDEDGIVEVGDGCLGQFPRLVHPEREWIENASSNQCVNIVTIDGERTHVETYSPEGELLQEVEREVRSL